MKFSYQKIALCVDREYDQNDRVNPAYQLDPATGKTKSFKKE